MKIGGCEVEANLIDEDLGGSGPALFKNAAKWSGPFQYGANGGCSDNSGQLC
jgi:hypothetical protein